RSEASGRRTRRYADHARRRPHAVARWRSAAAAHGPLPHARLLPAVRRNRIGSGDAARDHSGNAADEALRTPGSIDRLRRRRVDGAEEARRVLLVSHQSELIAQDILAYLE